MSETFPPAPGGGVRVSTRTSGRKEASLSADIDARISRLLNQLDDPSLTDEQISQLERKLKILKKHKVMQT